MSSDVEVFQAKNGKLPEWSNCDVYCGKVRCPECGFDGYLGLKRSGSFQVMHYVSSCRINGKRRTVYRFCTLWSLGKLIYHPRRCLNIAVPLWGVTVC